MRYENQTRGTSLTKEADTCQTAALPAGATTWLMSNKHRHAGDHAGLQVPGAAITSQYNEVPHKTAQHATAICDMDETTPKFSNSRQHWHENALHHRTKTLGDRDANRLPIHTHLAPGWRQDAGRDNSHRVRDSTAASRTTWHALAKSHVRYDLRPTPDLADARYKLLLAIALPAYNGNNRSTAIMQGSWRTTPAWTARQSLDGVTSQLQTSQHHGVSKLNFEGVPGATSSPGNTRGRLDTYCNLNPLPSLTPLNTERGNASLLQLCVAHECTGKFQSHLHDTPIVLNDSS